MLSIKLKFWEWLICGTGAILLFSIDVFVETLRWLKLTLARD